MEVGKIKPLKNIFFPFFFVSKAFKNTVAALPFASESKRPTFCHLQLSFAFIYLMPAWSSDNRKKQDMPQIQRKWAASLDESALPGKVPLQPSLSNKFSCWAAQLTRCFCWSNMSLFVNQLLTVTQWKSKFSSFFRACHQGQLTFV